MSKYNRNRYKDDALVGLVIAGLLALAWLIREAWAWLGW